MNLTHWKHGAQKIGGDGNSLTDATRIRQEQEHSQGSPDPSKTELRNSPLRAEKRKDVLSTSGLLNDDKPQFGCSDPLSRYLFFVNG